jgi:SAM-dependent methyltransferase
MTALLWGSRVTQALAVAARLGIADHLANGPMTVADLAAACGAHAPSLLRLLRALTTIDVAHEEEDGRFAITEMGSLLGDHHPRSMRSQAIIFGAPHTWAAWGDFFGAVTSGDPAFERVYGMHMFDYLAAHPETGERFNQTMTSISRSDVEPFLATIDLSDARRIVDIGGGAGYLLRGILEHYPRAHGVLFDLPHVVDQATEMRASPAADRCELIGGNMFDEVPAGGDVYLMKLILHDWDDEACLKLLRNCRAAIAPNGRLLVIDQVVAPSNTRDPAKWLDLHMMVMLGGRERTEPEFRELFATAGFKLTSVTRCGRTFVVEGAPA